MSTTTYPPVYMESLLHSRENDQLDNFKASQELNIACAKMINKAIHDSSRGAHAYNMGEAAKQVVEQYGLERAKIVLANTVQLKLDDGRFSSPNKEWAEKVALPDMRPNMRYDFSIETHPALLNGFIDAMKDMEHVAEKSAPTEKKPSVLGQLQKNMDTIAHADTKPPAPGKTKQDKTL